MCSVLLRRRDTDQRTPWEVRCALAFTTGAPHLRHTRAPILETRSVLQSPSICLRGLFSPRKTRSPRQYSWRSSATHSSHHGLKLRSKAKGNKSPLLPTDLGHFPELEDPGPGARARSREFMGCVGFPARGLEPPAYGLTYVLYSKYASPRAPYSPYRVPYRVHTYPHTH